MQAVKLSISLITYNQAKYIRQAIEGVLNQKTNFTWELIVGDDGSTDGTKDILIEYQKKAPELIRLILHTKKNEGIPGKLNFLSTLQVATGKYVALLDGDDYWLAPHKLQKQVDFLEANPDYSICCHRVFIKKGNQKPTLYPDEYAPAAETTYDIGMMAKYGNLVAAPSAVYRNKLFPSFPAWFNQSPVGDYVLHMLNAKSGKIKYFPEPMAVYRLHEKGAWGGQSIKKNAAGMISVIGLLQTEPFDETVQEGLQYQLRELKAVYLNELLKEDETHFLQEYERMTEKDTSIALSLIQKMKADMDSFHQSRTYKAMRKIKGLVNNLRQH